MLGAEEGKVLERDRAIRRRRFGGSEERASLRYAPRNSEVGRVTPFSQSPPSLSVSSLSSSLSTARYSPFGLLRRPKMSLVLSLVASSSRPTLAAAVRPARRFKADKVAKPKAGTKRAGGPPVDAGDSTTDTLKRVRKIYRLSATRESRLASELGVIVEG